MCFFSNLQFCNSFLASWRPPAVPFHYSIIVFCFRSSNFPASGDIRQSAPRDWKWPLSGDEVKYNRVLFWAHWQASSIRMVNNLEQDELRDCSFVFVPHMVVVPMSIEFLAFWKAARQMDIWLSGATKTQGGRAVSMEGLEVNPLQWWGKI